MDDTLVHLLFKVADKEGAPGTGSQYSKGFVSFSAQCWKMFTVVCQVVLVANPEGILSSNDPTTLMAAYCKDKFVEGTPAVWRGRFLS